MRILAAAALPRFGATAINAASAARRRTFRLDMVMSEGSSALGIHACPAHDLQGRVQLRPFGDFRRGEIHALQQRAMVLEMEALGAALRRVRREANRQDEVDQIHPAPDVAPAAPAAIPSAFTLRSGSAVPDFL